MLRRYRINETWEHKSASLWITRNSGYTQLRQSFHLTHLEQWQVPEMRETLMCEQFCFKPDYFGY
ncbi:hypothetical protein RchiOBHm_Chr2g0171651 [Rosa chinensis]|uniref:Uncharacterized protein n=1 Tax=Rosa chinensis TaxID=74649 RepID=A0A2P6S5D0_ROSCH|nr:hypothetical protein RchiOBHm_Chr2g0171651 [Rosa chinensis]